MKTQKTNIKAAIAASAIPIVLSLPLAVHAATAAKSSTAKSSGKTVTGNKNSPAGTVKFDAEKQIVKEAADAAKATRQALTALENNQPQKALTALEKVSGNLHILLSRDPALGLIPIDFQVQVAEGITDLKTIDRLEDELDDLIDDNKFQAARPIVDSLIDEVRVTTVYLPLATYPAAIDRVAPLIDAGKIDEAKQLLYDTLDTFVSEQEVTPLGVIRADKKLREAFKIEHTGDLSKQETKAKIHKLIDDAERQIKVAEALGYGTEDDYEGYYDSIDELKKSIGTGGFKDVWSKMKRPASAFHNKIVHPHG